MRFLKCTETMDVFIYIHHSIILEHICFSFFFFSNTSSFHSRKSPPFISTRILTVLIVKILERKRGRDGPSVLQNSQTVLCQDLNPICRRQCHRTRRLVSLTLPERSDTVKVVEVREGEETNTSPFPPSHLTLRTVPISHSSETHPN